jgi:phosphohistidine phosphatase
LKLKPDIYAASLDTLLDIVQGLPDEADRVMLVGHNPGFEDAAAALAAEGTPPPRLPTCGLAHLEFDVTRWRRAKPGTGRLVGVYTPE